MTLEEKVQNLPDAPGCYLMKGPQGQVIYVGKAKSLRHRVRSYFQTTRDADSKTRALVSHIADVDFLLASSEIEALILENNLIKKYRPRYNVVLRDDKNYPCLQLTTTDVYPRLYIVRGFRKDGNLYFGPFTSSLALRETLRVLYRVFQLRQCPDRGDIKRARPCLYYQIHQCLAPCDGHIERDEYGNVARRIALFFHGRDRDLLDDLRRQMRDEAERENFEAAARIRDSMAALEKVLTKQRVVSATFLDQDVIGLLKEGAHAQVEVMFVRSGKVVGTQSATLSVKEGDEPPEVVAAFLKQFYGPAEKFIPQEIIAPVLPDDADVIAAWLGERRGAKVTLVVPQRGDRAHLLALAQGKAEAAAMARSAQAEHRRALLEDVRRRLRLSRLPQRIEGYDISNIQGTTAVGSLVCFEDGRPAKSQYRRYRVRGLEEPNDYQMMHQVLARRFSRALAEGQRLPDLLVIDGGKGQLAIARAVLTDLGVEGVEAVSLAKDRFPDGSRNRKGDEKIYLPQAKGPLVFPRDSPVLHLLQHVRDEAHRFAITYHRRLRRKRTVRSPLDEVRGIGATKRKELLSFFGSLERIARASVDEITRVPHITRRDAEEIVRFLRGKAASPPGTSGEAGAVDEGGGPD